MEWVETTAKTVDEARDRVLDQLGVDEADAQIEVLEEPRPGLFGRMRGEARVRARVAPREQRPKQERRPRRKGGADKGGADKGGADKEAARPKAAAGRGGGRRSTPAKDDAPADDEAKPSRPASGGGRAKAGASNGDRPAKRAGSSANGGSRSRSAASSAGNDKTEQPKGTDMDDVVTVSGQADIMQEFLEGLLGAFDLQGEVKRIEVDDETMELDVQGDDLGLLIGPKGQTLAAVQDLARSYLQRTATGTYEGRVRIDVGGYRQRRRVALERFVGDIAEAVKSSGVQRALEPMGPADRKVVHDTVNELEGVRTLSEGQDPRRRVVIIPDGE